MTPVVAETPPATPAVAKPWIFSAEEIEASPSRQDGMLVEEEREVRKTGSKLIASIGQGMVHKKASLMAINSGKVFFHRVFMVQSLKKQNPRVLPRPSPLPAPPPLTNSNAFHPQSLVGGRAEVLSTREIVRVSPFHPL